MQAIFESIFDVGYLVSVITLGIIMLRCGISRTTKLFGIMALVLGLGDAFHLVPRIYALITNSFDVESTAIVLNAGKMITSVTMTAFYVLLFFIWRKKYEIKEKGLSIAVLGLAVVRLVLIAFPQNLWFTAETSYMWGIYRNIPFAIMGIIIIVIFYMQSKKSHVKDFRFIALAVLLSFAFYVPVVLLASTQPLVGMLMMPKTVAYLLIVIIGYRAHKKELQETLLTYKN